MRLQTLPQRWQPWLMPWSKNPTCRAGHQTTTSAYLAKQNADRPPELEQRPSITRLRGVFYSSSAAPTCCLSTSIALPNLQTWRPRTIAALHSATSSAFRYRDFLPSN
jgi:hypothetical protein